MRRAWAAVLVAGALALSACGTATAPGTTGEATTAAAAGTASTAPSPHGLDVSSLVGTWSVTGAQVAAGQTVTMSVYDMRLWVPCGYASAMWRGSTSGLFGAAVDSWSGSCETEPTFPWLDAAAGWRQDGAGIRLVDLAGQEVAALAPAPAPTDEAYKGIPVPDQASLTDQDRKDMNASPSMGEGIASGSTREQLVASWIAVPPTTPPTGVPPGTDWADAGFTLADNGTWRGTDGCNGGSGRWAADGESRIIATSGLSTLVGCNNVDAPRWLASAFLAGFTADGTLVLFGYDGKELGRLTRA